ncbi:hypothetical protein DSCA_63010 [Desulfosarcina alkanivorans]|uniref:Uncharacterized protein n=1 Tax=Desulfosarcina alkanivorans TaxID=571177 RepID=A0A5K7YYW8_9BACT|nr:hypothetical protein [Desulfosarcina alkanivorans]BBO72371.1 hypothetical protein DSCA_63010 [Desulfosarcina alkanivorans]
MDAYANGVLIAEYWPKLPVGLGYSFVPVSIYQNLAGQADEIRFIFQVRTSNSNSRAYSKRIIIDHPSSTVSITPKKKVVVVPLD